MEAAKLDAAKLKQEIYRVGQDYPQRIAKVEFDQFKITLQKLLGNYYIKKNKLADLLCVDPAYISNLLNPNCTGVSNSVVLGLAEAVRNSLILKPDEWFDIVFPGAKRADEEVLSSFRGDLETLHKLAYKANENHNSLIEDLDNFVANFQKGKHFLRLKSDINEAKQFIESTVTFLEIFNLSSTPGAELGMLYARALVDKALLLTSLGDYPEALNVSNGCIRYLSNNYLTWKNYEHTLLEGMKFEQLLVEALVYRAETQWLNAIKTPDGHALPEILKKLVNEVESLRCRLAPKDPYIARADVMRGTIEGFINHNNSEGMKSISAALDSLGETDPEGYKEWLPKQHDVIFQMGNPCKLSDSVKELNKLQAGDTNEFLRVCHGVNAAKLELYYGNRHEAEKLFDIVRQLSKKTGHGWAALEIDRVSNANPRRWK